MNTENYQALVEKLEEISHLKGVMATIGWDQEVVMPPGAAQARSEQISALAGIIHERVTDPRLQDCLDALDQDTTLYDSIARCNIREAQRNVARATKVPKKLVQEMAKLSSQSHLVWVAARKENKFSNFAPVLKRFLELKKEWAQCVFPNMDSYDANIDNFEQGTTKAEISPVFARLKSELIPLIKAVQESSCHPDRAFLQGTFPVGKQEALARQISRDMGFQFDQGRMDVSVHPFCGGSHPTDVRITTRYQESNFIESLYAVIHETGHGLYEQGRMMEGRSLPASESLTMGIHESQSLFWERMIAQNKYFCAHYFESIRATFPENLDGESASSFYQAINSCKPDFIRVEADELTYPLHIILRYEIESALFDGSIGVDDLPEAWNELMFKYLGVKPPTDTLGVLQDSHWSSGAFGYFPSYTLGAIYACQFYRTLVKELPETEKNIEAGNFMPIKNWLNEKIHRQGRLYTPQELVQQVTGEGLNPDYFVTYLKQKYGDIYRLG